MRLHGTKLISALALLVPLILACCSAQPAGSERVSLKGHFAMAGNAPFAKLVFRAENGASYEVAPVEAKQLSARQGGLIAIEADMTETKLETADGKHSRTVRMIRNITVLSSPTR
ncbi:MAG: hypothetical protein EPN93_18860 [Spirochaetes bacterium]|nr:MAG: hypothetical protein EPN93_18860 [Spirochaetota bacterium]